jgi:hypothetical protein
MQKLMMEILRHLLLAGKRMRARYAVIALCSATPPALKIVELLEFAASLKPAFVPVAALDTELEELKAKAAERQAVMDKTQPEIEIVGERLAALQAELGLEGRAKAGEFAHTLLCAMLTCLNCSNSEDNFGTKEGSRSVARTRAGTAIEV